MKEEFSKNGARDRPVLPDEEKIRLSKDRKIANRAKAEAGVEETAFRQGEKTSTFAASAEAFPSSMESADPTASAVRQRMRHRIKRARQRGPVHACRARKNHCGTATVRYGACQAPFIGPAGIGILAGFSIHPDAHIIVGAQDPD